MVNRTPVYGLPMPEENDNYSLSIVNEVTQKTEDALVEHRDQINPVTSKALPADGDYLVLADSSNGWKKVRLLWGRVVELLKVLFYTKAEVTSLMEEKANVDNPALAGVATLNGNEIATTESGTLTLLNGWQAINGYTPTVSLTGKTVSVNALIHGGVNSELTQIAQIGNSTFYPSETRFVECGNGSSVYVTPTGKIDMGAPFKEDITSCRLCISYIL